MINRYWDEDSAFRRVEAIKASSGAWPGVIRHKDGSFSLTYDPAARS